MIHNRKPIEDTYFLNASKALKIARQKNMFGPYDNLQICYYNDPTQSFIDKMLSIVKENLGKTS